MRNFSDPRLCLTKAEHDLIVEMTGRHATDQIRRPKKEAREMSAEPPRVDPWTLVQS